MILLFSEAEVFEHTVCVEVSHGRCFPFICRPMRGAGSQSIGQVEATELHEESTILSCVLWRMLLVIFSPPRCDNLRRKLLLLETHCLRSA